MGLAVQSNYDCGTKKFFEEMKSCEEALFHLQQCKGKSLDHDKDGRRWFRKNQKKILCLLRFILLIRNLEINMRFGEKKVI